MHRNDPQTSPILWWPQKNIHKIFITPKKYSFFWKPQKILKFRILNPKNGPSLRKCENIRVPPPPPGEPPSQPASFFRLSKLWKSVHFFFCLLAFYFYKLQFLFIPFNIMLEISEHFEVSVKGTFTFLTIKGTVHLKLILKCRDLDKSTGARF